MVDPTHTPPQMTCVLKVQADDMRGLLHAIENLTYRVEEALDKAEARGHTLSGWEGVGSGGIIVARPSPSAPTVDWQEQYAFRDPGCPTENDPQVSS